MDQKIRTLSKYIAILLDICVMLVAYAIANLLRFSHVRIHIMTDADYAVFFWFVIIAYIAVQLFFRTNIDFLTRDKAREAFLVLKQYVIVFACVMTFFYVMKLGSNFSRLHMGYFFVISIIGTYIGHLLLKEILGGSI